MMNVDFDDEGAVLRIGPLSPAQDIACGVAAKLSVRAIARFWASRRDRVAGAEPQRRPTQLPAVSGGSGRVGPSVAAQGVQARLNPALREHVAIGPWLFPVPCVS